MNWEEVSAIGQMLGTVAVFITLGYLAVQLRHSRAEVRRSITQTRAASNREMAMYRASNERVLENFGRATEEMGGGIPEFVVQLKERTTLTRVEAVRLFWLEYAVWLHREQTVSVVSELSEGERTHFENSFRTAYGRNASPVSRLWSDTAKATMLNPVTVRYIDNLLAQSA